MRDIYVDAGQSVARTVKHALDFTGRSRIVDVVYYWFASTALGFVVTLPTALLPWDGLWVADRAIDLILAAPFVALFARRLQDQGLPGWGAFFLIPFPFIGILQSYRAVFAVRNPEWLYGGDPFERWAAGMLAAGLVILVLSLRPGTKGPNRYGLDPRDVVHA